MTIIDHPECHLDCHLGRHLDHHPDCPDSGACVYYAGVIRMTVLTILTVEPVSIVLKLSVWSLCLVLEISCGACVYIYEARARARL